MKKQQVKIELTKFPNTRTFLNNADKKFNLVCD